MSKIEWLKDILGNNYIGVNILNDRVYKYIEQLKDYEKDYDKFIDNQKLRDNNNYHITLVSLIEINQVNKSKGIDYLTNLLQSLDDLVIDDINYIGLGESENKGSKSYFVIIKSNILNSIRHTLGLPKKDLHIPLGFNPKDVQNVPKDKLVDIKSVFIKVFKTLFLNDENLTFIRSIKNFDKDLDGEIIPYRITNTSINVWVGGKELGILEIDGELRVYCQYDANKPKHLLTKTEILNYIK